MGRWLNHRPLAWRVLAPRSAGHGAKAAIVFVGCGPLDNGAVLRVLQLVAPVFQLFTPPVSISHLDFAGGLLVAGGDAAGWPPDRPAIIRDLSVVIPPPTPAAVRAIVRTPAAPASTVVVAGAIVATPAPTPATMIIAGSIVIAPAPSTVIVAGAIVTAPAAPAIVVTRAVVTAPATATTAVVATPAVAAAVVVTTAATSAAVVAAASMGKGRGQRRCLAGHEVDGHGRGDGRPGQKQHHQPRSCRTVQG
jgi:hypothetical protein